MLTKASSSKFEQPLFIEISRSWLAVLVVGMQLLLVIIGFFSLPIWLSVLVLLTVLLHLYWLYQGFGLQFYKPYSANAIQLVLNKSDAWQLQGPKLGLGQGPGQGQGLIGQHQTLKLADYFSSAWIVLLKFRIQPKAMALTGDLAGARAGARAGAGTFAGKAGRVCWFITTKSMFAEGEFHRLKVRLRYWRVD